MKPSIIIFGNYSGAGMPCIEREGTGKEIILKQVRRE
jgi:hypothetical protein